MFHFDRSNKKLHFYVLTTADDPSKFLTVTNTKAQISEYAEMLIKVNHIEHYKMWASIHKVDPKDDNSWSTYYSECIDDAEKQKYLMTDISYRQKDIAAILRMFVGCMPLGCSFDQQSEYIFLKNVMAATNQNQKMQAVYDDYVKAKSEQAGTVSAQIVDMSKDEIDEDVADGD